LQSRYHRQCPRRYVTFLICPSLHVLMPRVQANVTNIRKERPSLPGFTRILISPEGRPKVEK